MNPEDKLNFLAWVKPPQSAEEVANGSKSEDRVGAETVNRVLAVLEKLRDEFEKEEKEWVQKERS